MFLEVRCPHPVRDLPNMLVGDDRLPASAQRGCLTVHLKNENYVNLLKDSMKRLREGYRPEAMVDASGVIVARPTSNIIQ